MSLRWENICIDTPDPAALGRWWSELLGWPITFAADDDVVVAPPPDAPASAPEILFLRVEDPTPGKNRLHLDLRPDDRDVEVARAEAMGATRVDVGQTGEETWVVLADPEGNEFCILRALTPEEVAAERVPDASDGEAVG